jgi:uncharacterized protein (DUF2147 family)
MQIKELFISTLFTLFISLAFAQSPAQTPIGKWKTIDDETNKAKAIIEITKDANGKLNGKVIALFRDPGEDPDPVCDVCPGDRKGKKTIGMEILTGLKWHKGDEDWQGGDILDPDNGKIYDCYIAMESPTKLKVRGYIGFSLFGRTQYWYRADED